METATGLAASEEVHGSNQLYEACNIMQLDKKATSQPLLAEPEQIGEGLLVLPNPYEVFATSVNPARPKSMCPRQIWGCSCWVRGTASSVPKALKAAQRLPTLLVR